MALLKRLSDPIHCFTLTKPEWLYLYNQIPEGTQYRVMEDEDYWYYNLPPTMMGSIIELWTSEEPPPKRKRFSRRKFQVAVKKQSFGFARALEENEEPSDSEV